LQINTQRKKGRQQAANAETRNISNGAGKKRGDEYNYSIKQLDNFSLRIPPLFYEVLRNSFC
jgi:hypothetical protein